MIPTYRIVQTDPGCFAPQMRRRFFWRNLNDYGWVMPWGSRWSGPLEDAARGVRKHMDSAL